MKALLNSNSHIIEKVLIVSLVCLFTAFFIYTIVNQQVHNNELQQLTLNNLEQTGVTNIVTAVLLNYRAYDTLIEFAVFICVAITVLPYVLETSHLSLKLKKESQVLYIAKTFIPLTIIMAGYLLWIGSVKPGGAFQAAALLAGCLVLLSLANVQIINFTLLRYRLLMSSGLIAFLVVILLLFLESQVFLSFPDEIAGIGILVIEFFATFAIAIILFLCFESINKGHL